MPSARIEATISFSVRGTPDVACVTRPLSMRTRSPSLSVTVRVEADEKIMDSLEEARWRRQNHVGGWRRAAKPLHPRSCLAGDQHTGGEIPGLCAALVVGVQPAARHRAQVGGARTE